MEVCALLVAGQVPGSGCYRRFMGLRGSFVGPGCPVQGAYQRCRSLRLPVLSLRLERRAGQLPGRRPARPAIHAGQGKCVKTFTDDVQPVTDFLSPHHMPVKLRIHVLTMHRAVPAVMTGAQLEPETGDRPTVCTA